MLDLDGPLSGGQGRADPCGWTLEARRPAGGSSQRKPGEDGSTFTLSDSEGCL